MDTLLVQAVILLQVVVFGLTEVVIEIKLVHYSNSASKELNGKCCDVVFGPCSINRCDNMFTICLDHPGSSESFSSCPIGSEATSRIFENNDNFNFPSSIPGGVSNPFTKKHSSWEGGFRIKFRVYDYDPTNSNDLVDNIFKNIYLTPVSFQENNQWITQTVSGTRARIEFQYRVQCEEDYYGDECAKYCVDTDSEEGHYTCDDSGNKVCDSGWAGASCDQDINECESTPCLNGGSCEHGIDSYVCACPANWGGSLCHVSQDACMSTPCANNATCESDVLDDGTSNYTCTCAAGWEGDDCSDEIYECASTPCKYDGICQDLVNGWNCICKNGTEGRDCGILLTTIFDDTTAVLDTTVLETTTPIGKSKTDTDDNEVLIPGGKQKQSDSDGGDGVSDSVMYSMIVLGLLLIIFILAILLVRRRKKRKSEESTMEVPVAQPPIVAISNLQLDQATGGAHYETSLPAKKIPFEEEELGSFQNPVYMLTVEDLQARNAQQDKLYVEFDDAECNDPEKENPYVDMDSVQLPAPTVNPVTEKAEPNLYFVD